MLIPCTENCIHQTDGSCTLNTVGSVTNNSGSCAHKSEQAEQPKPEIILPHTDRSITSEPLRLL